MALHAPYLEAIQAVPGDTPKEKFRWITNLVKERISVFNSVEEVLQIEKLPQSLVPLIQVEAARMLNKKNKQDQSNYEAIAEALKSEDSVIVHRALQATNFFDGTNKNITNVRYFFDYLFPEVSVNTRTKIVSRLGRHLARKEPVLAQEFFEMLASTYGTAKALPLLPACNDSFIYDTIVERKLRIDTKTIELLFRKNQDLIVRWIKLWKPTTDPAEMNFEYVSTENRNRYLQRLVKTRLQAFVEICETLENVDPPLFTLNNKSASAFLKNGKEHFLKKPLLYFRMLPRKMLNATDIELVFPKLFPENIKDFKTDDMLTYLDYYPEEKKAQILLKTYREIYNKDLLADHENVTSALLLLLPAEERVRQARIKLAKQKDPMRVFDYKSHWTCYLPLEESIPTFKEQIATTDSWECRSGMVAKMIYSCKINANDGALLEVLKYVRDRHKNERSRFLPTLWEALTDIYDVARLSENHWTVLFEILQRAHVKNELNVSAYASMKILEAAAEYKIIHNLSLDPVIDMIVAVAIARYAGDWNILTRNPEYERRCLEACLNVVSQRYQSGEAPWKDEEAARIMADLVSSIYTFNREHAKLINVKRVRRMSIKDYPWLMSEVEKILSENQPGNYCTLRTLREQLQNHEKDLYDLWVASKAPVADFDSGAALALLRKRPERILEKWPEYLKACKENWHRGSVRRFIHVARWYKDIPMKLAEQCYEDVATKKDGTALYLLALLLHGHTFAKLVEPYIPLEKTIGVHHEQAKADYQLIRFVPDCARVASPPVPLDLVGKMCEGDYLPVVLGALTNVCRRTALPKAMVFAEMLATKRVSVRKHGVRLLDMISPRDYLSKFLLSQWKSEEHYSIRQVLFEKAKNWFCGDPGSLTWYTFSEMISSLTLKDETMLNDAISVIRRTRVDYIVDYLKLLLQTIDRFEQAGIGAKIVTARTYSFLKEVQPAVCNSLSEELAETILKRFVFHSDPDISKLARALVINAYLLSAKEKLDSRMKTFSNVFRETIKRGWDVPDPEISYFYPVNYAVRKFVCEFVVTIAGHDTETRLVEGILKAFVDNLTPTVAAFPYLFLIYAKERATVKTPKELGVKLGEKLPELTQIFTPLFVPYMTDAVKCFLTRTTFKDFELGDMHLSVLEGLLQVGSTIATLMAVKLLDPNRMTKHTSRYEEVVKKLRKSEHPAILSAFHEIVDATSPTE